MFPTPAVSKAKFTRKSTKKNCINKNNSTNINNDEEENEDDDGGVSCLQTIYCGNGGGMG